MGQAGFWILGFGSAGKASFPLIIGASRGRQKQPAGVNSHKIRELSKRLSFRYSSRWLFFADFCLKNYKFCPKTLKNETKRLKKAAERLKNATKRLKKVAKRLKNAAKRLRKVTKRLKNETKRLKNAAKRLKKMNLLTVSVAEKQQFFREKRLGASVFPP